MLIICGVSLGDEAHRKSFAPKSPVVNVMEGSRTFWRNKAENYIVSKLNGKLNTNKAKNVIFFIGDGMSLATIAATRMYEGKEENNLSFENFPHFGLAKTYCVDKQVADSACSAVAYLGGVKSNNRLLGLNANVLSRQCIVSEDDHVDSIVAWAQKAGKATGIVTTTRITHATPAGAYAHISHRDWENNIAISSACRTLPNVTIRDIAYQLIHNEEGKNLKVILGGGRRNFINTTVLDDEGSPGLRTDGRNLIDEWLEERNKIGDAKYVWHKQQLNEIDFNKTDYLMGLFENDHCLYNLDVQNNNLQDQEPSLTDMTIAAIKMLKKDDNGFFLFVEGGKIDHAHHSDRPHRALDETKELSKAIEFARRMTDEDDTLIVVSSDHSHVMTFSGYPDRGKPVLGIAEISDEDFLPYETLSYANGPGYPTTYYNDSNLRYDVSLRDLKNPLRRAAATVQLSSESHAGEDVGVYASGPFSHLLVGSFEQNVIPLVMAYASKIGPYFNDDDTEDTTTETSSRTTSTTDSAVTKVISVWFILVVSLFNFAF